MTIPSEWTQFLNRLQANFTYLVNHSGGGGSATDVQINNTSITNNGIANIVTNTAYDASSNKIATMSDVPDVMNILQAIYPVGSLYIGTNSTCPMSALFGTWTLVASDKALWTGDGTNGNTTIEAKLPNIKGSLNYMVRRADVTTTSSGCFQDTTNGSASKAAGSNGSSISQAATINFDASDSHSIYSDNATTVQPPAYVVNVWRRTA